MQVTTQGRYPRRRNGEISRSPKSPVRRLGRRGGSVLVAAGAGLQVAVGWSFPGRRRSSGLCCRMEIFVATEWRSPSRRGVEVFRAP